MYLYSSFAFEMFTKSQEKEIACNAQIYHEHFTFSNPRFMVPNVVKFVALLVLRS
jgi:hypothetical protein